PSDRHLAPDSFPTRRSSDLAQGKPPAAASHPALAPPPRRAPARRTPHRSESVCPCGLPAARISGRHGRRYTRNLLPPDHPPLDLDRKSTRLNSSHLGISYAV